VISPEHPVVFSRFEAHAREIEIDAVADRGELVLWAICEHIEDAGVHSGDATLVLPPQTVYIATIRRVRQVAAMLARSLAITGPFNVQFLARHNAVKVIECNLRASRSFPFVSKVTGENFAGEAMRRMLGVSRAIANRSLDLDYVGVKAPMFSFSRLSGADPMPGVEMLSTGEVGCLGRDLHEALQHALLAAGISFPRKGVLLSLGPVSDKYWFTDEARTIAQELNLPIYATRGTAEMLAEIGIPCTAVEKSSGGGVSGLDVIEQGLVDLVINIPREYDQHGRPDGYLIRRQAIDSGVPLVTDLPFARAIVEALRSRQRAELEVIAWNDFLGKLAEPSLSVAYRD
jgi:carbamoyl-phosphate synthase large subunit